MGETFARRAIRRAGLGLAAWFWLALAGPAPSYAATPPAPAAAHDPAKLYVDADRLSYDKDRDVVTADGDVVLYYKQRVLQADHVIYDRKAKRVTSEGHVKLTDERGDVTYANKADLTDDFGAGFANSVQAFGANRTRFTAPRIERSNGAVTVFQNGVYTACEPCQAHPEWPPLWQVRAKEITEDQTTHTVYFRDAYFDAFGVPVAYLPFFSAPDPSVTRQTGFLSPTFVSKNNLGLGVSVPYFLALAPNYDLTVSPSFYTLQGPFLDAEWRQRTTNGVYSVRLTGIDQLQPHEFLPAPYGAGNRRFRGSAESQGKFYLNENWTFGWDLTAVSDRFYLTDYRLRALDTTQYFFGDLINQVYLRGQAERGFFDLTGYNFQPTNAFLDARQDPYFAPTFDYHRTFAVDADRTGGVGGEMTVTLNAQSVNRQEAFYQTLGAERLDPAYSLYQVCGTGTSAAAYRPGTCLLKGIAGDYTRGTEQVEWRKKIVDPYGQVWQPFAFERLSGEGASLAGGGYSYASSVGSAIIPNYAQPAFFAGQSSGSAVTGMAGVGLEYRYPFVAQTSFGEQTVSPIGQIIARPNENLPRLQPNEDAQSLVFDDTTLFQWSKYSGFDRVEGGTRANYGFQYTDNLPSGGHVNIVAGQSVQVAGQNSYTLLDATNIGLQSGLDKTWSNYVAGETLQPTAAPLTLGLKQQFDTAGGKLDRFDAILSGRFGGFTGTFDYANYASQPLIGYPFPREGFITKLAYKYANVTVTAGLTLDMSRRFYDPSYGSPFYATQYNLGFAYEANDCTTFKVAYNSTLTVPLSTTAGVPAAPAVRDQSLLFELDLRTLGDIKGSSGVQ